MQLTNDEQNYLLSCQHVVFSLEQVELERQRPLTQAEAIAEVKYIAPQLAESYLDVEAAARAIGGMMEEEITVFFENTAQREIALWS